MKIGFELKSPNTSFSYKPTNQTRRPFRIADILLAVDEEDDVLEKVLMGGSREGSEIVGCSSLHRIMGWWLSWRRRHRVKRDVGGIAMTEEEGKKNKDDEELAHREVHVGCSMNELNGGDSVNSESSHPGHCRDDASFNRGVGCCLLYLIAASKNELNKMVDTRMQMEMFLQNAREELQKTDSLSKLSGARDTFSYSCSNAPEGPDFENHASSQTLSTPFILPESSTVTVCNQSLKWETPKQEGMRQLELELESELERLQLQLDTEKSLEHPWKQTIKVTTEDSASSTSQTETFGDVIDPVIDSQESGIEVHCGVPPCELERRLHELLASRQQEQIRELEAAVECLKHELREKEMEVNWWRDTARIISQHVPEPS